VETFLGGNGKGLEAVLMRSGKGRTEGKHESKGGPTANGGPSGQRKHLQDTSTRCREKGRIRTQGYHLVQTLKRGQGKAQGHLPPFKTARIGGRLRLA